MKKLIAALFTVAISATGASAADLPARTYTKAPPMVAPVYNWTGFYVGLNAGGAWNEYNPTTATVFSPIGYFATTSASADRGGRQPAGQPLRVHRRRDGRL